MPPPIPSNSKNSYKNDNSTRQKRQVDKSGREINPYIPKYIANVPWYQATDSPSKPNAREGESISHENDAEETTLDTNDYLAHQRLDPSQQPIDFSVPQAGAGIEDKFEITDQQVAVKKFDDWDSKRDRWHGFNAEEWDDLVKNWDANKSKSKRRKIAKTDDNANHDDSDDTDYELELMELGLTRKDIKTNLKEDPLEKTIRDRQDVPAYIQSINANPDNKISYDPKSRINKDPSRGFLNDRNQFVRYLTGEAEELERAQKFAWEQNKQYEDAHQRQLLEQKLTQKLANGRDENEDDDMSVPVDLNMNLEASPTLMMLKTKQLQKQRQQEGEQRKLALLNKYGGKEHLQKPQELQHVSEVSHGSTDPHSHHDNAAKLDHNGMIRSQYSEDIYPLNHTSIWGSYYQDGQWGYACCKQLSKKSYCTKVE